MFTSTQNFIVLKIHLFHIYWIFSHGVEAWWSKLNIGIYGIFLLFYSILITEKGFPDYLSLRIRQYWLILFEHVETVTVSCSIKIPSIIGESADYITLPLIPRLPLCSPVISLWFGLKWIKSNKQTNWVYNLNCELEKCNLHTSSSSVSFWYPENIVTQLLTTDMSPYRCYRFYIGFLLIILTE